MVSRPSPSGEAEHGALTEEELDAARRRVGVSAPASLRADVVTGDRAEIRGLLDMAGASSQVIDA
jgi:hypothetical protein